MGIPLCVIRFFPLAVFNTCSLCLIFVNLINMCLGVFSPWVNPVWDSLGFLDLGGYFLPHFREVSNYYLLKYFLMAFLFFFFFWDFYVSNVEAFDIIPEVSEVVLISFNSFFFFPLCFIYFHHSIFLLTYPIFCFSYIPGSKWTSLCGRTPFTPLPAPGAPGVPALVTTSLQSLCPSSHGFSPLCDCASPLLSSKDPCLWI